MPGLDQAEQLLLFRSFDEAISLCERTRLARRAGLVVEGAEECWVAVHLQASAEKFGMVDAVERVCPLYEEEGKTVSPALASLLATFRSHAAAEKAAKETRKTEAPPQVAPRAITPPGQRTPMSAVPSTPPSSTAVAAPRDAAPRVTGSTSQQPASSASYWYDLITGVVNNIGHAITSVLESENGAALAAGASSLIALALLIAFRQIWSRRRTTPALMRMPSTKLQLL